MMDLKCPVCRSPIARSDSRDVLVCTACGFEFSLSEEKHRTEEDTPTVLATIVAGAGPDLKQIENQILSAPKDRGSLIPGYKMITSIGKGTVGEVFRAEQVSSGRLVAIRLVNKALSGKRELVARFEREADALSTIQSPNIAAVIQRGTAKDGRYFVVGELAEGETLRQAMTKGHFGQEQREAIVVAVAEALAAAHSVGVIHRDLKPENVVVNELPDHIEVKVLDFGLAGAFKQNIEQVNLTQEGMMVGSPFYMSPEMRVDPGKADARTDIFSLGVLLYELITGDIPLGIYRPPSERNPAANPALDPVLQRMLEADVESRYQKMSEAFDELKRALGVTSIPPQLTPRAVSELPAPILSTRPTTTERRQWVIEGKAAPGHKVILSVNDAEQTILVPDSGQFSAEVELYEGQNLIVARAECRGERSAPTEPVEILSIPRPPDLTNVPAQTSEPRITIGGRASPGLIVQVQVLQREYKALADSYGQFSVDVELDEGPNIVFAWTNVEGLRSKTPVTAQVLRTLALPAVSPLPATVRLPILTIEGTSAPDVEVNVGVNGRTVTVAPDQSGAFRVPVRLKLGNNLLTLWTSKAGCQSAELGPFQVRRQLGLSAVLIAIVAVVVGLAAFGLNRRGGNHTDPSGTPASGSVTAPVPTPTGTPTETPTPPPPSPPATPVVETPSIPLSPTPTPIPSPSEEPARPTDVPASPTPIPTPAVDEPSPSPASTASASPSGSGPSMFWQKVKVPRGGASFVFLPKGESIEIRAEGAAEFSIFVTPAQGREAYQKWFDEGSAALPILKQSLKAKKHSLTFHRNVATDVHLLILDNGDYPVGRLPDDELWVTYTTTPH